MPNACSAFIFSKAFRGAIQLCLQGDRTDARRAKAWDYYQQVLEIVETKQDRQYPEMEVLWLMTKAWNHGIHQYRYKSQQYYV